MASSVALPLWVQLIDGNGELPRLLPEGFKLGDSFELKGMLVVHSTTETPDHLPNGVVLALYEPTLDSADYTPPAPPAPPAPLEPTTTEEA